MLKDYIDCKNDATSKFLADAPQTNMMSDEVPPESPVVVHTTTITLDDVFEIECSSVAEEIIIEDVKCFDSSSPDSETVELIGNVSVEELQSPIADEVNQLINNEHINSKHALEDIEYDKFFDKILPKNDSISTNNSMEVDTPFLNSNSSQPTNDVEIVSTELVENVEPQPTVPETPTEPSANESTTLTTEVTDKPYKCHICGKLFSRNSSLKCHIRLHVEGPDSLLRGTSETISLKSHFIEPTTKKEEVVEPATEANAVDLVPYDETASGALNSSRESSDLADDDDKRDYKCIICEKTFSRKSSLTFHYKFHPKSPTSRSQEDITAIAGEAMNDETAMEVDSLAVPELYKCDKCNRTFPQKNTYLWHLKMHETNVRRKSSDCNSLGVNQTDSVKDLDTDMTNDVDMEMNTDVTNSVDVNPFKCHLCPRSFPQLRGLKTHSGVHKKKLVDEPTKGPETLNQIAYEEVSSRKYDCCKKHHNHDGEVTKLYKCNVCYKCFCDINNLKRHLARNHQQEDTSEASDNDIVVQSRKKSISMSNDSRTMRKQTGTRIDDDSPDQKAAISLRGLYKCGFCNAPFDEIHLLVDHVSVHVQGHSDSLPSIADDSNAEELCCVVCEKTFRNQNSLSRHMNEHRRREEEVLVRVTSSGRKIRERRPSEDLPSTSPIKCIPCNRYFESIRAKHIHDASKHPAEQNEPEEEPAEDPTTDNPLKCIPCNRYFDSIRGKHIHDFSQHPVEQTEPEGQESDNDDDAIDDNNEEYVCECCNRNWANLRALARHKSWAKQRISSASADKTVAESESIDDVDEEMDSFEEDDLKYPEENKTENDVTSSVKCACCNDFFPNIPALNAHLSGQTNGTFTDATSSSDYERKDLDNSNSLRHLVKCDRCDKFCSSIPALKLHIMSDHTKKFVPPISTDSSSVTASKPSIIPDRTKKPVLQSSTEGSSTPGPNSNIADRPKKHISQSSVDSSNAALSKSQISSDGMKKSVPKSSTVVSTTPALKSQIISDRSKKSISQSSLESSSAAALKSNIIFDRTKKSVSHSSTESSSTPLKSNIIPAKRKKSISQSSTESPSTALKSNPVFEKRRQSISQSSVENSSAALIISDHGEKSVLQDSTKSSIITAVKSSDISEHADKTVLQNSTKTSIVAATGSNDISDHPGKSELRGSIQSMEISDIKSCNNSSLIEKSVSQDSTKTSSTPASISNIISDHGENSMSQSTENFRVPAAKSCNISNHVEKSVSQGSAGTSSTPGPKSDIISDHTEKAVPRSIKNSSIPAAEPCNISDHAEKSVSLDSTQSSSNSASKSDIIFNHTEKFDLRLVENSSTCATESCNISDHVEESVSQDFTKSSAIPAPESSPQSIENSSPTTPKLDISNRAIESNAEMSTEDSSCSAPELIYVPDSPEEQSTALVTYPAESQPNPEVEHNQSTKPAKKPPTQSNAAIVDKSVVIITQSVRRRKSIVEKIADQNPSLLQCDQCDETFTSNRALNSHKTTHVVEPSIENNDANTPNESTTFICCDRTFTSTRALKLHQNSHPPITNVASAVVPVSKRRKPEREAEKSGDTKTEAANSSANHPSTDTESDEDVFRDYKCTICEKQFASKKSLRHHRSKHFESGGIDPEEDKMNFQCPKCNKKFDKETSLRVHKAYHTTKEKNAPIDCGTYTDMRNDIYRCNACEREFETVKGVNKHYSCVHKEQPAQEYSCNKCGRKFPCSQGLAGHTWSAHMKKSEKNEPIDFGSYSDMRNGMYKCNQCGREFDGKRGVLLHNSLIHKEEQVEEEGYKCSICDRSFNCSQGLAGHMWAHKRGCAKDYTATDDELQEEEEEEPEDFSCPRCDKSYSNSSSLSKHCRTVHGFPKGLDFDVSCLICFKSFVSKSNLKRHRKNVHLLNVDEEESDDEEPPYDDENDNESADSDESFRCKECDRVFGSQRGLSGHMQIHQEYVCPDCNHTCISLRNFNIHKETCAGKQEKKSEQRTESEAEEYKCDHCDRSFRSARSLGSHKPVHREQQSEQESDNDADNETDDQSSEFPCLRCDRSFTNARSLAVHVNSHTAQDNPLELLCPQCDRDFVSFRSLSAHFTTHRVDQTRAEFPCHKCKESFNSIRGLHEHFDDVHRKIKTRRSRRLDSKSSSSKDRSHSNARSQESSPDLEKMHFHHYPCVKCNEKFISERSLSHHKRKCSARSKSVEDASSTRNVKARSRSVGDPASTRVNASSNVEPAANEDVADTSSGIRKSRRLQSFAETVSSQQEPMDVDVPENHQVEKSNVQLSCVFNDNTDDVSNDTAPKPNCDICSITFDDLKSLAQHLADSHQSSAGTLIDQRYDFGELQVRVHHCTQCDKIFANRVGLRRHSLTHSEPIAVPWEQPPLNLQCPQCPKIFPTTLGLKRHVTMHKNAANSTINSENSIADESEVVESETSKAFDSVVEVQAESSVKEPGCLTNGIDSISEPKQNNVDEPINDTNTNIDETSASDTNTNPVENPITNTNTKIITESIHSTTPLPKPTLHSSQIQDDSINRQNESLKNVTNSSCDSQSDSTCDDEPNTSRSSLPIVSDEPIACLSCKICSRQFNHVKGFNKHVQWHKFNDDAVDGEETTINDDPKLHRSSNGATANGIVSIESLAFVKCDICAEKFKKSDTLKAHAFNQHNVIITSPILYRCEFCDKSFPPGNSLFMHLKSHISASSLEEDIMPYECASCEKCFRLKDDLLEHVKTHLNGVQTPSIEPLLNGSTDQTTKLNGTAIVDDIQLQTNSNHAENDQIKLNVEPLENVEPKSTIFQCSYCDKTFGRKCYLHTHIRCHKKKKPNDEPTARKAKPISPPKQHQCSMCEVSFRLKTSLAVHVQKHFGGRLLSKSLKRPNEDNSYTAEDGVRNSKRTPKDIS